jgi:ABC-type Na+ efflux pump permease subunit
MFWPLFWFELKNRLIRPSSLIYFSIYFALSFLCAIAFAGAFKGVILSFMLSNRLALNSPMAIQCLTALVGYLSILIIAPIFGQSINQDFETKFHHVLFATPIRKSTYFFVRFLASFVSALSILLSIGLGLWFATLMPFIDRTMITENRLWFYVVPYLSILIPNILLLGALFLAVIAIFKKMASVYITSIVLFVAFMTAGNLLIDLDNQLLAVLIDPFGVEAMKHVARYWSLQEQSTQAIPLVGYFLYNRLLWVGIGLFLSALAYILFNPFALAKEKRRSVDAAPTSNLKTNLKCQLLPHSWKVFWQLSFSEFKQAFSNVYFLVILLCSILFIFSTSGQIGKILGTETLPVTWQVLEFVGGMFYLFVALITSYYGGELVWKDREQRSHELIDSTPVSNRFLYFSKLLSLGFIQLFFISLVFVCSILIQLFKGYTHFELGVYAQHLLLYTLPSWLLASVFVLFAHTLARSKMVGHSIVVLYFILIMWLSAFGFDHHLYLIGVLPHAPYSDMNGFGTSLWRYAIIALYWSAFYCFLSVLTLLFWQRGAPQTWTKRLKECRSRFQPVHKSLSGIVLCSWVFLGAFIYYNTNILNTYKTKSQQETEVVDYERDYGRFKKMAHPNLVGVNLHVDLFPGSQSMKAQGVFTYRNTSSEPIKTFMLNIFSPKTEIDSLIWSRPATLVEQQHVGKVYDFEKPLQPNEEIALQFHLHMKPRGFENSDGSRKIGGFECLNPVVRENGTFFSSYAFFPVIGYQSHYELEDDQSRRKYGLPEKTWFADVNDQGALQKNCISSEGDWIDFEITISTSPDQIAIAPGYLQKEWQENGRRYFHYKMDQPMLSFYAIQSGRYEVVRDQWNDVAIEIYHHPGHTSNISRMIRSVKSSLDYYTKNFSPYQFKQFRIIEFPRYEVFAQAFPNTIPYSEALGFIARVNPDDPKDIDYPFYVTAHEMAHQWWGHQVVSANVEGATMLDESLAQYSALMVMEKEFGHLQMRKFLKYALDGYLQGRSCETKKEKPLARVDYQPHIHYQKGTLVFYALKDYLGEEVVNRVLRDYIRDVGFQKPPFTRAIDLVERFREAAPDDLKYLIEDLFETITFYSNRTDSVHFKKNANGKYEVEICSNNRKLRADGFGLEQEIPMEAFIDVGIFDQKGDLQYLKKHRVVSGQNTFRVEVDQIPSKAGLDPLNKLIDRVPDGNLMDAVELHGF